MVHSAQQDQTARSTSGIRMPSTDSRDIRRPAALYQLLLSTRQETSSLMLYHMTGARDTQAIIPNIRTRSCCTVSQEMSASPDPRSRSAETFLLVMLEAGSINWSRVPDCKKGNWEADFSRRKRHLQAIKSGNWEGKKLLVY